MDIYYNTLNNFAKKYITVYKEQTHPSLFSGGTIGINAINYLILIKQCATFKEALDKYKDVILPIFILSGFLSKDINYYFTGEELDIAEKIVSSVITTSDTFSNNVIIFYNRYVEICNMYFAIGRQIEYIEQQLLKYEPYKFSIQNRKRTIKFSLKLNNETITVNDALFIFNNLHTSSRIPIIIFTNSQGEKYTKVNKNRLDFDVKLIDNDFLYNSISFYFEGKLIVIDTVNGVCFLTLNEGKSEDRTLENIKNSLSFLTFEEISKADEILGTIIFDFEEQIDSDQIYRMVVSDPVISFFFSMDENAKPWADRSVKFNVRYRDYDESILALSEQSRNKLPEFNISYSKKPTLTFEVPINKVESKIGLTFNFRTKNEEAIKSFSYKFSRLLRYILFQLPITTGVTKMLKSSIGGTMFKIYNKPSEQLKALGAEFIDHERKKKGQERTANDGSFHLTRCGTGKQPTIIDKSEIYEWIMYGRSVGEYPPKKIQTDNRYYLVCPLEENPHLFLMTNLQDPGSKFRYLPCCRKDKIVYSMLQEYINFDNNVILEKTTKSNRKAVSEFILSMSDLGEINDTLSTFLIQAYGINEPNISFVRLGVTDNLHYNDSFINCVSVAVNNTIYDTMSIRQQLASMNLSIYKQELYDWDDNRIISELLNPSTFIDPYLFYRGIEELFGVQIFIFSKGNDANPISFEQENTLFPTLEVPRCKQTHIRLRNKRPIVCIYKNYGQERTKAKIPSCELLQCTINNNRYVRKFINNDNFEDSLFNYLDSVVHPFEWDIKYDICLDNPYNFDWQNFDFGSMGPILSQEIDAYGKTNALLFKGWTLLIPPSQPLNLPIQHYNMKRPELKSACDAIDLFDSTNSILDLDGIWIPFNGKQKGIKVLCDTGRKEHEEVINFNIDTITEESNNTSILMQIIAWLWRSDWNNQYNSFPEFKEWWGYHSIIDNDIIFKKIPSPKIPCNNKVLPVLENFTQRIELVASWWPFFFYNHKIHTSKALNILIRNYFIREQLQSVGLTITDERVKPKQFITELIVTKKDFNTNADIIFTDMLHVKEWFNYQKGTIFTKESMKNMLIIYNKIDPKLYEVKDPFLFIDSTRKKYIIQNITRKYDTNPYIPALAVAKYFRDNNSNPRGYYSYEKDIPSLKNENYVVYTPDNEKGIDVFVNMSGGTDRYLQIIQYSNILFAAMLPIL